MRPKSGPTPARRGISLILLLHSQPIPSCNVAVGESPQGRRVYLQVSWLPLVVESTPRRPYRALLVLLTRLAHNGDFDLRGKSGAIHSENSRKISGGFRSKM